jgi:23S rRNA (uracil1939-C5)-methyltransferase
MRARPGSVPVERGERRSVTVDEVGDGPDGIARVGDYVLFVPGVLPGERALVEVTSAARKFGRAELVAIEAASPQRTMPRCPHFLQCGGCHLQHQQYASQLERKRQRLQRGLDWALGEGAVPVAPTVPAASSYGERHKVVVHLLHDARGRLVGGLHRARSPELVEVTDCPASDPLAWDLVQATIEQLRTLPHRAWDPFLSPRGLLRSVLVRTTTTGDAHLVLVAMQPHVPGLDRIVDALHRAGATSISVNHNDGERARLLGRSTELVSGRPFVHEQIGGLRYHVSPAVFFQTSPRMAEQLVQHVVRWLDPSPADVVADLFCGVGLLTLPLAARARSAWGVELHGGAVEDARASAGTNDLANVTFRCGSAENALRACRAGELPRPRLVALDPPREGLMEPVIAELRVLAPDRLAYVSCEPQALQRDLVALRAAGFDVRSVVPFDMFPQTALVESLACLERRQ